MASSRRKARKEFFVQKPQGQITQRVQAVGPERFGIVSFDCAKARSTFLVCDFYGKVLIEPSEVEHTQPGFRDAIARIRAVFAKQRIADSIVAIERTGNYHRPVQDAFRQAAFETRLVHPFTSKQYRQTADPDNKRDDTDLAGIFRAACHGFGLIEPDCPDVYQKLQWLSRQRRDLVRKTIVLRNQIHEYLHALMPGYEPCFRKHFFDSPVALAIARQTGSAQAVRAAGLEGLRQLVPPGVICRTKTLERLLLWAEQAPVAAHPQMPLLRVALDGFDDDRLQKIKQIAALEQQMAHLLVRTPYVVLLALPGINVVGAANLAGELGPIEHYANSNHITGRAGLAPARYQSDRVDSHGPLRRRGNRRLRHALMMVADNLLRHNHYYSAKSWPWQIANRDPRWIRVKIAKSFSRLMLAMVSQHAIFPHPACQTRHYVLDKLLDFHHDCGTDMKVLLDDLDQASRQLTPKNRQQEIDTLRQRLKDIDDRRRGPVSLASIIPLVLARLGVAVVQSEVEGRS